MLPATHPTLLPTLFIHNPWLIYKAYVSWKKDLQQTHNDSYRIETKEMTTRSVTSDAEAGLRQGCDDRPTCNRTEIAEK